MLITKLFELQLKKFIFFNIDEISPLQRFPLQRGLQLLLMLIRLLPLPLRRLKLVSIDIILVLKKIIYQNLFQMAVKIQETKRIDSKF